MSWNKLLAENRVEQLPTDKAEIDALRSVVERSLSDANLKGISDDGRFGHAYDACRCLAVMAIRASGYKIRSVGGAHYTTFQALKVAVPELAGMAAYLDLCRTKRNSSLYEDANFVSNSEAEALLMKAAGFRTAIEDWLKEHHSSLC